MPWGMMPAVLDAVDGDRTALAVGERVMHAFVYQLPVRFHEVDPAGIVFFARYFQYAHDAQEAWLKEIGFPLETLIAEGGTLLPLVHAEADYNVPLRMGQEMTIELRVVRLGDSSLTLETRIGTRERADHAVVRTVHVCVDPITQRSQPLPAGLREAIAAYCDSVSDSADDGS